MATERDVEGYRLALREAIATKNEEVAIEAAIELGVILLTTMIRIAEALERDI